MLRFESGMNYTGFWRWGVLLRDSRLRGNDGEGLVVLSC